MLIGFGFVYLASHLASHLVPQSCAPVTLHICLLTMADTGGCQLVIARQGSPFLPSHPSHPFPFPLFARTLSSAFLLVVLVSRHHHLVTPSTSMPYSCPRWILSANSCWPCGAIVTLPRSWLTRNAPSWPSRTASWRRCGNSVRRRASRYGLARVAQSFPPCVCVGADNSSTQRWRRC